VAGSKDEQNFNELSYKILLKILQNFNLTK